MINMEVSRSAKFGLIFIAIGVIFSLLSIRWHIFAKIFLLDPRFITLGVLFIVIGLGTLFYGLPTTGRVLMLCIIGISFIVLSCLLVPLFIARLDVMITCCILYSSFFTCAFIVPAGYLIGKERDARYMKALIHVDAAVAFAIPLGFLLVIIANFAAYYSGTGGMGILDYFMQSYLPMFGLALVISLVISAAFAFGMN